MTELNDVVQKDNEASVTCDVLPEENDELLDRLDRAGKTVVKVAASTVVATTLASTLAQPPRAELITLPEPTPIVQMYQAFDEDPDQDEDDEQDESVSRWRRLLRALKYLLVALALVASVLFGVLKGCAGIAGGLLLPHDDEQQEQTAHQTQTEDERGVAVAG